MIQQYSLVKNGLVVNIIMADEIFLPAIQNDYDVIVPYVAGLDIGQSYPKA